MLRRALRMAHGLLSFLERAALILVMLYAAFCLWDNQLVYNQVENAMAEMREIKALDGDEPISMFEQLRAINPDVTSWIMMDGTAIDYPVLQGSSNFTYINRDVYGEFAMLGSIFMDFRNSRDYTDRYTLLMGHDMSGHRMFSDLNLYKEEAFFRSNTSGLVTLPDGTNSLLTLSCMVTSAGNSVIFNPMNWNSLTPERILRFVQEDASWINEEGLRTLQAMLDAGMEVHIVSLTTCTGEFTDARTVLLTLMDPMGVSDEIEP